MELITSLTNLLLWPVAGGSVGTVSTARSAWPKDCIRLVIVVDSEGP